MTEIYNKHIGIPLNQFVEENKKLAHHVAKKYHPRINNSSDEYDDILQFAFIGLVKAYDNYDPKKFNTKFSTYAVPMMHGEIQRYFRDHSIVKFPRIFRQIWRAVAKLGLDEETNEVIAKKTGYELKYIEKAMPYYTRQQVMSLDMKVNDNEDKDVTLLDQLGTKEDFSSALVNDFVSTLDERTRLILHLIINRGMTQSEIGKIVGVSQVQVSRIIQKLKPKWEQFAS